MIRALLFLLCCLAGPAAAQVRVPAGDCAIVVASRQSLPEVRSFIDAWGFQSRARVYRAQNGWFAITLGTTRNDGSADRIAAMKRAGTVPSDSFCSTMDSYSAEIPWRASAPAGNLWAEFDARPLSRPENRMLQAALTASGDYVGTLDGEWGRRSQDALDRFALREFQTKPLNAHAALLAAQILDTFADEGWEYRRIDWLAMSALLPQANLTLTENEATFSEWRHRTRDLGVLMGDYATGYMVDLHGQVLENAPFASAPYTVRQDDLWISAFPTGGGRIYLRSDLLYGTWSTIMVQAGPDALPDLALITASLTPDPPPNILPSIDGPLLRMVAELSEEIAAPEPDRRAEVAQPQPHGDAPIGSGTAFFVTDDGIALTNHHVIAQCATITVGGASATVLADSAMFDLAALRIGGTTTPLAFSAETTPLNADITIAGYPLSDILGGLNINRGSVSSLKGPGGDETKIQISAPVQSGNSGGPVIDRYGNLVGVVVEKMNSLRGGEVVQNVNFAVRGEIAKAFLSSNGIHFAEALAAAPLSPEDAARRLSAATKPVLCY
ncbi:S1 family peptidase [Palleronia abyssalis]|uniref:Uncharacterized protein n=1 Tax=Palleronia abyssalis TaxID=1501240 RepID=A0A2R8BT97_9RHOB|nr:serine protease [Palleronia abyssalis]SPJ23399.1 hypothetical protein PAA8504_01209 [Palleronia abyssalis]